VAGAEDRLSLITGGSRFREEVSSPGSDEIRTSAHDIISGSRCEGTCAAKPIILTRHHFHLVTANA
jgi:hypothetical protein